MVIAIEAWYVPSMLCVIVTMLAPMGMCIEDEVVIGAEHPVALSANAPKGVSVTPHIALPVRLTD